MISDQRRRHPRSSRMLFLSLAFLGFINPCLPAPLTDTRPSSSSSSSSSAKKSQEVGSPSELAWQAWLLVDAQPGSQSNLDSASILRRITPKSVFIAPALPACAEGYRADTMGRCVKNVNIDQEAQINFLLQRLNAMYANHAASPVAAASSSHDNKQSSGPLQVNIPLVSSNSQTSKVESGEREESEDAPLRLSVLPHSDEKKHEDAIVTVYEIKNETTASNEEAEETFFLGHPSTTGPNKSDHDDKKKPDAVVPVAEFVEEANETTFSDVVDYKISLDLKTLLNVSRTKLANETDETSVNQTQANSTESSPTLVLLLSPTKLPHMASTPDLDQLELAHNGSSGHVFVHMANLTGNLSEKEIISVSVPESILHVKKLSEVVQEPVGGSEKNQSGEESVDTHNTKVNDSQEVEYEDEEEEEEDYIDVTDLPEEESLEAEGGEILKHGEAGMTIPVKNIDRINFEKHRESMKDAEEPIVAEHTTEPPTDAIYILLNDSASSDKDEAGSNVSSEVSIDGDFIMETTVLNVNTGKKKNVTLANRTLEDDKFEESSSEPEVIFAPQDNHGTISTSHSRKRVEAIHPGTIHIENVRLDEKSEPQEPEVSTSSMETERLHEEPKEAEVEPSPSSESLLFDSHRLSTEPQDPEESQPITEIRTMDRVSFNEDALIPEDSKEFPGTTGSGVPLSSFRPAPLNFKPAQDYVRFPSYIRSPESHVRFPSEEANSIHGQDYKDRSHSTEDGLRNSAKNEIHQKPSYWWVPPGWRTENHSATVQATAASDSHQIRQKPRPMLVRFWTSLYPTSSQVASTSDSYEGQRQNGSRVSRPSSRRVTYYKEMSPQDVNRVFAQKSRTPIGG